MGKKNQVLKEEKTLDKVLLLYLFKIYMEGEGGWLRQ